MRKTQIILLLLTGLFGGCANNEAVEPEPCTFPATYVTLREYKEAMGIIRARYDEPGSYYIDVLGCADCPYIRDIPEGLINLGSIPCNLPETFQKDSLPISFSGALKINTEADYRVIDIAGLPLELFSIVRKPLERK